MAHVVDLFGQPIMWLIDVELAVYLLACLFVESALSVAIILGMILTCFVLKLAVHVIVEIQVL